MTDVVGIGTVPDEFLLEHAVLPRGPDNVHASGGGPGIKGRQVMRLRRPLKTSRETSAGLVEPNEMACLQTEKGTS